MPEDARVDAAIAGDVGVADARGDEVDEELVLLRLTRQHLLPLPVVLRVGHDALARHRVL